MDKAKKHILLLNSKDRTSGAPENCVFHLNDSDLHECHHVQLKDVFFTNLLYNIKTSNNILIYDFAGTTYNVVVPAGYYSLTDLITKLNALQTHLVFSNNTQEKKLNITSASPSFINKNGTINKVIGFVSTVNGTPLTTYTGYQPYNLIPSHYIHVISNKLAESDNLLSSNNKRHAVIASIPIAVPFGYTVVRTEERDSADYCHHNSMVNLSTIDIRLVDDDFNQVDLNGSDFIISFTIKKI